MFRAERPQAGRMRQFHQIGAEAIGSLDPAIDAEIIILLAAILEKLKIKNYKIRINNLGCKDDKVKLSKTLRKLLTNKKVILCKDCKNRLISNPLRVLDCKNESCRNIVRSVFKSIDFLCEECTSHFNEVLAYLDRSNIGYGLNPYIVRGLDYYTRTVFEVSHQDLGAQDAIGAGGRYDNLISDMGGPKLGAAGFALGIERIFMAAAKQEATAYQFKKGEERDLVYIATIGEDANKKGVEIVNALRRGWDGEKRIIFDMDYENKSLKSQMREADRLRAELVLIIGDDEIAKGEVTLRNMHTKEQSNIKFENVVQEIKKRIG
jgi:histidyl-tRNA synthetase